MLSKKMCVLFALVSNFIFSFGQTAEINGTVTINGVAQDRLKVVIQGENRGTYTNHNGEFSLKNLAYGDYTLLFIEFSTAIDTLSIHLTSENSFLHLSHNVVRSEQVMDDVIISATLKAIRKDDSPVPVEIYSSCFFQSNPTPSLFESLQNVNGVRPQLNCNICNTGDIHINGLEGPYTMVLIDGMPIVSGLSTVYGLSGIPQSLIERIEIIKGPASTLYGSEAVGGLINVITKTPKNASVLSFDHFSSTWAEFNTDLGIKYKVSQKITGLLGINHFNYQQPIDKNDDGFTDLTLSHRISIFNTLNFERQSQKKFQLAGRYVHEDRWGGQMNYSPRFRGGDSIYGESIYTRRWETFGTYELATKEKLSIQISANGHHQNSFYGTTPYFANQTILFGQFLWHKPSKKSDWLLGLSNRWTFYDDNTVATENSNLNVPSKIYIPGIFLQNDLKINRRHRVLLGIRADYNRIHGAIISPRANYKIMDAKAKNILRLSIGNGYRVANVFTEDHAALTGARTVVFKSQLKPERSYNTNVNFLKKIAIKERYLLHFDATVFYTYFSNKILPDYESDPNVIFYDNLTGYAESKGFSLNIDFRLGEKLSINAGTTLMSVTTVNDGIRNIQPLTERVSATWRMQYTFPKWKLVVDYTGNVYGPMKLPLLGELDDRAPYSPVFSIQNLQLTKKLRKTWEVYGGVKNLLNFRPPANSIARAHDPFDKNVVFDAQGQILPTPENPKALSFDPTYVYASNQGIRTFLGIRFKFK